MPVGSTGEIQVLKLVEIKDGVITTTELMPVRFVPLTGDTN